MSSVKKASGSTRKNWDGQHRFEHWLRDRQVYFITARCRNRTHAFASEVAKQVFWRQFETYTGKCGFVPWIASLISNHYHVLGFLREGKKLPEMMRLIHGSVAKLVNDTLTERLVPFWIDHGKQNYFDGCIRNEKQCRRAFRYIERQSVRHKICKNWRNYPHTRKWIELERGVKRALEIGAFLEGVPYKRYSSKGRGHAD